MPPKPKPQHTITQLLSPIDSKPQPRTSLTQSFKKLVSRMAAAFRTAGTTLENPETIFGPVPVVAEETGSQTPPHQWVKGIIPEETVPTAPIPNNLTPEEILAREARTAMTGSPDPSPEDNERDLAMRGY